MGLELLGLSRESGSACCRLGNRRKLNQALGALVDANPENSRATWMRERAELGETNRECLAAGRRLEPRNDLVTSRRERGAQEPEREMPVGWRDRFARQIPKIGRASCRERAK